MMWETKGHFDQAVADNDEIEFTLNNKNQRVLRILMVCISSVLKISFPY